MKALIRLIGVLVLVAIFLLPGSAPVFASEDWAVYMSVTTEPDVGSVPGEGYHFGFGARDGAVDEYAAADGDEIAPPDPMAGVNAYFYYAANSEYTRNLVTSVVAPAASITWPLVVKRIGGTGTVDMTLSWDSTDIANVPAKYVVLELQDTGGTTLANMKAVDHYTFSASQGQIYDFQIIAESEEIPTYELTIASDPVAGGTATDETDDGPYQEGASVDIKAEANPGWRFVNWTAPAGVVANPNAAQTTFTMPAQAVTVTASFEELPSVDTDTGTGTAYFQASLGTIEELQGRPVPADPPADVTFPHGMFSFQVTGLNPGDEVTITVELPSAVPAGTKWWKYHDGQWHDYDIPVTISGNTITITLIDGGVGDIDDVAGQITDPGGPGVPTIPPVGGTAYPISRLPILAFWIALAAVAAGVSMLALRRRRAQI